MSIIYYCYHRCDALDVLIFHHHNNKWSNVALSVQNVWQSYEMAQSVSMQTQSSLIVSIVGTLQNRLHSANKNASDAGETKIRWIPSTKLEHTSLCSLCSLCDVDGATYAHCTNKHKWVHVDSERNVCHNIDAIPFHLFSHFRRLRLHRQSICRWMRHIRNAPAQQQRTILRFR